MSARSGPAPQSIPWMASTSCDTQLGQCHDLLAMWRISTMLWHMAVVQSRWELTMLKLLLSCLDDGPYVGHCKIAMLCECTCLCQSKAVRGVTCTFLGLTAAATLSCICANVILFTIVPSVKDANCLLWPGRYERWLRRRLLAQGAEMGPR